MPRRSRERPRYTVTAQPDSGFWLLRIIELPELLTQARFSGEIDHMARDLIAITQGVPPDSFDLMLPNVEAMSTHVSGQRPPVTDTSIQTLYDRLIAIGVPVELAGDVSADLHDIAHSMEEIQALYRQIAEGRDVKDALFTIESESRDHLPGHVKSLRKTARNIRRLTRRGLRKPASGDIGGH